MLTSTTHTSRRRLGFSLVEMLITLTMLTLVVASIATVLARQQRFYQSVPDVLDLRAQLRVAGDLLESELRAVSMPGGDIYAGKMLDSSIEFRSSVGETVACRAPTGSSMLIPPADPLIGTALAAWRSAPAVGDSVFVFDEGVQAATVDDGWVFRGITAIASVGGGCTGTPFTSFAAGTGPALALTLSAPLPVTIDAGAPVRVMRRAHYSLYRSSDGGWYLGFYDCLSSRSPACATIQPVAGPYRSYANPASGRSGLTLLYVDSAGMPTTNRSLIARIDIALRAQLAPMSAMGRSSRTPFGDTLRLNVGIRNRR